MTDYLRLNVIYDATVVLKVRSSTTLAKYDSAQTQLEVEVGLAFSKACTNENRLCLVFGGQVLLR